MPTIATPKLTSLIEAIFRANGSSPAEAGRIARYLVGANLTGHDSHGVIRVPLYVRWQREGEVVTDQTITLPVDAPSFAVVDGRFGFGQTVAPLAVQIGIDKCRAQGLSAVALRSAGHIGRVGDWAEMAAAAGLVSVHFVNAPGANLVAPFGGTERRFSTAPFCAGVPVAGRAPVILDFATSMVAEGKVLVASLGGKALPEGALISPQGALSTDPATLYGPLADNPARESSKGPGAIRTFGDHKGSGLAFMCELLGGALTGTGTPSAQQRRFANGMLSFYVDPARFDVADYFPGEVARYAAYVKSARPAQAGGEVLLPGEMEQRLRTERVASGVPLSAAVWESILAAAAVAGVEPAAIEAAGA